MEIMNPNEFQRLLRLSVPRELRGAIDPDDPFRHHPAMIANNVSLDHPPYSDTSKANGKTGIPQLKPQRSLQCSRFCKALPPTSFCGYSANRYGDGSGVFEVMESISSQLPDRESNLPTGSQHDIDLKDLSAAVASRSPLMSRPNFNTLCPSLTISSAYLLWSIRGKRRHCRSDWLRSRSNFGRMQPVALDVSLSDSQMSVLSWRKSCRISQNLSVAVDCTNFQ
jgi:hypothetical protein